MCRGLQLNPYQYWILTTLHCESFIPFQDVRQSLRQSDIAQERVTTCNVPLIRYHRLDRLSNPRRSENSMCGMCNEVMAATNDQRTSLRYPATSPSLGSRGCGGISGKRQLEFIPTSITDGRKGIAWNLSLYFCVHL